MLRSPLQQITEKI